MTEANSTLTLAAKLGEGGRELARWQPSSMEHYGFIYNNATFYSYATLTVLVYNNAT
jgi:hypothetical protein